MTRRVRLFGLAKSPTEHRRPLKPSAINFLLQQRPNDVDRYGEDDGAEEVGQQRMSEHRAPDLVPLDVGVGDLVGHADAERDVREVQVAGRELAP